MAMKGRERKNLFMAITLLVLCVVIWMKFEPETVAGVLKERARTKREALPLPDKFDDSAQINQDQMRHVEDWTILANFRKGKIDPGFWACMDLIQKLSPEEISRRSQNIDFKKFKDNKKLIETDKEAYEKSKKAAIDYRNSFRGKFIRVKGRFVPIPGDFTLQDNPDPNGIDRSLVRRFVLETSVFDILRSNIPEAYFVYSLNDSEANYKDLVQVEALFLKVFEFTNKKGVKKYLPLLIARDVKVLKNALEDVKPKDTESEKFRVIVVSALLLFCGFFIMIFLILKNNKQKKFRDEVFDKIKSRKKNKGEEVQDDNDRSTDTT